MKTHLFGTGNLQAGFITLGSATNHQGELLRFRVAGVDAGFSGRVQFHAHLQELDEIGVVACMVTCEPSELPQKVWVSARVEGGRVTGLGKIDVSGPEVMGVLGGVLNDVVLLIDPIVATGKAERKSRVRKKNSKKVASGLVEGSQLQSGDMLNPVVSPVSAGEKFAPPNADCGNGAKEGNGDKGEIPALHDRVEVLSPHTKEPFPCTFSAIPILDHEADEKSAKPAKSRRNKQREQTDASAGPLDGDDGVLEAQSAGVKNGFYPVLESDTGVTIDPSLMLKGEDGQDISDRELLF